MRGTDARPAPLRRLALGAAALASAAAALIGASPAYAANVDYYASPTGSGTTCSGSSPCELGEALMLAAGAGNSADAVTINVAGGTYTEVADTISSGSESSLKITGPSAASTILEGNGNAGTLAITSTFTVTLSGLTIEDGSAGAGYGDNLDADGGTVVAEDDVFSGGGDSDFDGSVAVRAGTLDLTDSTITGARIIGGNGSSPGGLMIYNSGNATVTDSTVSANDGPGIKLIGTGAVSVADSTIANNTSQGILDTDFSNTAYVTGSTLTGNSGGVATNVTGGMLDLAADLLASNGTSDCSTAGGGTIFDAGYDYSDDSTCPITSGTSHHAETDAALAIGPLSSNTGAPQTENVGAASVAHDVVLDSVNLNGESHHFCLAADERGAYRLQPGATTCDAGASQTLAAVVYFASPAGSGSCLSAAAACSIASAVTLAESSTGAVTISLAAGTYSLSGAPGVLISGGTEYSMTLDGAGEGATVLAGDGSDSLVRLSNSAPVTLENLKLENGGPASTGSNCYAGYGEDLCADNSTATLIDVTATSTASGGGDSAIVNAFGGDLVVEGSTVSGGVDASGVGLQAGLVGGSNALIEDSTIEDNALAGVAVDSSTADIESSTLTSNELGGVFTYNPGEGDPFVSLFGSTVAANTGASGGVAFYAGTVELGGDLLAENGTNASCVNDGTLADPAMLFDAGYNYSDDSSCSWTSGTSFASESALHLGALAANGGPTETFSISATSQAHDKIPLAAVLNGQTFCSESDQRGIARTQSAATACDAGAYQYAPPVVSALSASALEAGLTLTITGSRLAGVTAATCGSSAATIGGQSETSLTLTIPTVAAGSEPITLTNADGSTVAAFTVLADPIVATTTLPGGQVGSAYSQTLTASGGAAPYSFAIASGSLPAGLTLSAATGVISGTPLGAGGSTFAIDVTDGHSVSSPPQTITIAITAAPAGAAVPVPVLGVATAAIKPAGGKAPVQLSCEQAACQGMVSVTETLEKKVKGHKRKTVVTLAGGAYTLAAGDTETVELTLSAKGRSVLAHASKHHVHGTLHATVTGGAAVSQGVAIT
jgi:hypothetical protein